MKGIFTTLAVSAVLITSNTALSGDKFKVVGGAKSNVATKEFKGNVGIAYKDKTNSVKIVGKTHIKGSKHKEGVGAEYTYKSKSGKTRVKAKVKVDDFNNSDSVWSGVDFSFDL